MIPPELGVECMTPMNMLIIINKVVISNPNLPGYTSGGIKKLQEKYHTQLIYSKISDEENDLPGPRNDHKHGGWHVPSH